TGPIFIIVGFLLLKFPPKTINGLYGYRTPSSMTSQERWDFAQKYAAKEMIKLGALLTISSFIGLIFTIGHNTAIYLGLALLIAGVIILLVRVERAIKKEFADQ